MVCAKQSLNWVPKMPRFESEKSRRRRQVRLTLREAGDSSSSVSLPQRKTLDASTAAESFAAIDAKDAQRFGLVKMKGKCYVDGNLVVEGDFQFASAQRRRDRTALEMDAAACARWVPLQCADAPPPRRGPWRGRAAGAPTA